MKESFLQLGSKRYYREDFENMTEDELKDIIAEMNAVIMSCSLKEDALRTEYISKKKDNVFWTKVNKLKHAKRTIGIMLPVVTGIRKQKAFKKNNVKSIFWRDCAKEILNEDTIQQIDELYDCKLESEAGEVYANNK